MVDGIIISSLDKCFIDQSINSFRSLESIRMLKNQRLSIQYIYTASGSDIDERTFYNFKIKGALADCAQARTVEQVPVTFPVYQDVLCHEHDFLRTTPGLYPDWLQPLHYNGHVSVIRDQLHSIWIDFQPKDTVPAGIYETTIGLYRDSGEEITSRTITIEVLNADLPEQEMYYTEWFHCDCLANYYHCEPWSERHWEIIENFARTAVENGINLLLTPIFTPPLDTVIGGERLTCQLIDVTVNNGEYSLNFDKLDRWIAMCNRVGIKYFEISHLFTQWGAAHAPKVMATVDGEYKRIFGWDTEATGAEYSRFIRQVLTELLDHLRVNGDDKRCFFHISDEPSTANIESYKASRDVVLDLLEGYTIMDAMSHYEFYEQGVIPTPIPCNSAIDPFIENKVKNLWTYYCCGQTVKVSNRLIAMPSWRNRSIGMQFYKYDIVGFLQWGYNFYNNCGSVNTVSPFSDPSGEYWVPAGDTYSVLPAQDGTALETLRIIVFHEAIEDYRAMKLCEKYYGKERVIQEIEKVFGREITFKTCTTSAEQMLAIRAKVDELIALALEKQ